VVTINEGYFESGWDNWIDGGDDCYRYTGGAYAFEGNAAIVIRDNSGQDSSMSLENLDLTSFYNVSISFHYYAQSMESNEDFFLEYFNGSDYQIIGQWRRGVEFSGNGFYSDEITITATDFDFSSGNSGFRFRCDASGNGDLIYIDAVIISGTLATEVCETSFEEDYGCWVNGNNTSRVRSNANTGGYSIQFDGDNGNDSYVQTGNSIDASSYSVGLIRLHYDGNGEVESSGNNADYLIIQYYNSSNNSWMSLPDARFGVNREYTELNYSIPSAYLTSDLRIRIVFDATFNNEYMYLDDTVITFY
jgi:hypothetical protein